MGFGSLGFSELIVIFVIVLVFFGPRRFPEIARSMGHAMREFRRSLNQIQRELEDADPRKAMPGREFLNDLGKPATWLDPNSRTGDRQDPPAARDPQITEEASDRAMPVDRRDSDEAESPPSAEPPTEDPAEQLPMFGAGKHADPNPPTGDRPPD